MEKIESLLGTAVQEAVRYFSMCEYMGELLKTVRGNDFKLVSKFLVCIFCTRSSLCNLVQLLLDRDCNVVKEYVSHVIQDHRSKIIKELIILRDSLSKDSCNNQMINNYIVAFEAGAERQEYAQFFRFDQRYQDYLESIILRSDALPKKKNSTIIANDTTESTHILCTSFTYSKQEIQGYGVRVLPSDYPTQLHILPILTIHRSHYLDNTRPNGMRNDMGSVCRVRMHKKKNEFSKRGALGSEAIVTPTPTANRASTDGKKTLRKVIVIIIGASLRLGVATTKSQEESGKWHVIMACKDLLKAERAAES
ncbi:protochlorophyllide reductase, chloroplastic-like protein [Tanacetum coccineum]